MSDENERSGVSAGSHNTAMATARLSAANTWLQEEIKRLRLTDAEREAIEAAARIVDEYEEEMDGFPSGASATLRRLLERLG
jgi:hypothetical protein